MVPYLVDKFGGKAVDNRQKSNNGAFVSPYLRNRLRSLEEAERARERARWRLRRAAALHDRLDHRQDEPQSEPPAESTALDAAAPRP